MSEKENAVLQLDNEINELKRKYKIIQTSNKTLTKFEDFPLSRKTLMGLLDANFHTATEIQQESILPAILGTDIIGAAITGSGKTLAFLVPVLENLYINRWSRTDGLGALIITPTRELAYQIFQVLRAIGKYHDFSAGLIIGGKNLRFEKGRLDQCNILVCTPGRLLQHMDENPLFNTSTMQILVLDEADRCLDMGFEETINAILENLPPHRQILLFSATQNRGVNNLARLKLKNPKYSGELWKIDKKITLAVPILLKQSYVVVELENKMKMLWSFIKHHLKQKIIVFAASCKQVKYIYEIFCKLRPGTSLLALYGTMNQNRRIAIYEEFIRKKNVVLFATDIASRGLDFPRVSWVVQLDCPEDVSQYIHRAGRSARNNSDGESLLVLLPSEEEAMVNELKDEGIPIQKISIDERKMYSPHAKIEALCAQNTDLKSSAQRAFVAYVKNVCLMKNKHIFKVNALNLKEYATSLGLIVTPRVRFLDRLKKKRNEKPFISKSSFSAIDEIDSDSNDELLIVKRADHNLLDNLQIPENFDMKKHKQKKTITKTALAKKAINKKIQLNKKLQYNEEGEEINLNNYIGDSFNYDSSKEDTGINIFTAQNFLIQQDKLDKKRIKDIVKSQHLNLKKKSVANRKEEDKHNINEECYDDLLIPTSFPINMKSIKEVNTSKAQFSDKFNHRIQEQEPLNKKKKITSLSLNDAETLAAKLLLDC